MKQMKTNLNAYEGENRSLHMKERIGYGVGDFANNMMYTPVNSFFTYFLTNVAGLGAGVVGTLLLASRLMDGVSDLIVGTFMEKIHSRHGKARPWLLWWCIPFAVSLVLMFSAPRFWDDRKDCICIFDLQSGSHDRVYGYQSSIRFPGGTDDQESDGARLSEHFQDDLCLWGRNGGQCGDPPAGCFFRK